MGLSQFDEDLEWEDLAEAIEMFELKAKKLGGDKKCLV